MNAIYLNEYLMPLKDENGLYTSGTKWVKEHNIFSSILPNDSWQIKEVPKKRKQKLLLGTTEQNVPFSYPLPLDNGYVIEKPLQLTYNEEIE